MADDDEDDSASSDKLEDRKKDYSSYKYVEEQLDDLYQLVETGFADKKKYNDTVDDAWSIYRCELDENQTYIGNSQVYVPIVRDAISARETRFVNMLFPQTGRYADVVGHDGKIPFDLIALLDDYVRKAELREKIAPAMIRTGDISGNYVLMPEWIERTRNVTSKKKIPELEMDGEPVEDSPEYDDVDYEEVKECHPGVTVLDPRNVVILPATCAGVKDADICAVILNFSKNKIKKYIKDGIFEEKAGKELIKNMSTAVSAPLPETGKQSAAAAGVRLDSKGNKTARVFRVWSKMKIRGETRLMETWFAGSQIILSCKRIPYWCDRVPLIFQPVEPAPDTVWGPSQVTPVATLQYQANDVANEGFDSAAYALLPIVMTDPEKNPRAGSMVLAMASVWMVDPNSTKFAEFPALWKDAFSIIGACKEQIFQSLGVNPAMIPHGNAGKKPSQAQVAQEQQVALESSADNVALVQEGVFSELLEWFYELDYQYRDEATTVKKFGQFGLQATMDQVEPFQTRERYEFRWYGTEGFKAQQQVQGMISWMNVLAGLPPQAMNGRKLDLGPMLEYITETICGPRIAPYTLIDQRHQLTMSPEQENKLLEHHFPVQVHEMDDDQQHLMVHFKHFEKALNLPEQIKQGSEIIRIVKGHIMEHIKSAKMKAQMAMGAQPGQVGGPGQPRAGAQVQAPPGGQAPPGAIHKDQMPLAMPRKAG